MEKNRLYNFIQKYYLNGLVEGVKIHVKDGTISTDFITEDRSTLGHISYKDVTIEDTTFGVFDTSQLVRMLNVLDNDDYIDFKILLDAKEGKSGLIVSFLAILELIKLALIDCVQANNNSTIFVKLK